MDETIQQTEIQRNDPNDPNFYDFVQQEIENAVAYLKKNIEIATNLRMTAAEVEVETAALYHAELWHDIEDLKHSASKHQS